MLVVGWIILAYKQVEHSSANSVISFIIFSLVAQFKHMESLILGDPGEVSRDESLP